MVGHQNLDVVAFLVEGLSQASSCKMTAEVRTCLADGIITRIDCGYGSLGP